MNTGVAASNFLVMGGYRLFVQQLSREPASQVVQ
jgi:hypothetical protein